MRSKWKGRHWRPPAASPRFDGKQPSCARGTNWDDYLWALRFIDKLKHFAVVIVVHGLYQRLCPFHK